MKRNKILVAILGIVMLLSVMGSAFVSAAAVDNTPYDVGNHNRYSGGNKSSGRSKSSNSNKSSNKSSSKSSSKSSGGAINLSSPEGWVWLSITGVVVVGIVVLLVKSSKKGTSSKANCNYSNDENLVIPDNHQLQIAGDRKSVV